MQDLGPNIPRNDEGEIAWGHSRSSKNDSDLRNNLQTPRSFSCGRAPSNEEKRGKACNSPFTITAHSNESAVGRMHQRLRVELRGTQFFDGKDYSVPILNISNVAALDRGGHDIICFSANDLA